MIGDYQIFDGHGVMPRAGGLLDQDPRWVEGVKIIEGALAAVRKAAGD